MTPTADGTFAARVVALLLADRFEARCAPADIAADLGRGVDLVHAAQDALGRGAAALQASLLAATPHAVEAYLLTRTALPDGPAVVQATCTETGFVLGWAFARTPGAGADFAAAMAARYPRAVAEPEEPAADPTFRGPPDGPLREGAWALDVFFDNFTRAFRRAGGVASAAQLLGVARAPWRPADLVDRLALGGAVGRLFAAPRPPAAVH